MRSIKRVEPSMPQIPVRKRVAAYARVSSGKDAMLHSLSAQVSYYSGYIQRRRGWEYVGVYADEALTGTKDERPEFQRLMNDCRDGKIDMVITKSIARFARNTVTMLEAVRELKSLGVDVYFEKENIHSLSGDGEVMLTILASYAQEESRSVSENCKWRVRKMFAQGRTNNGVMLGYRLIDGLSISFRRKRRSCA
jgi:site-specific DNA recombinase